MKVLILAGGLGSRLYNYTNGLYPKILLSLGNETFLDKVINFWFNVQEVEEMNIVFSEDNHIKIVSEYINVFFPLLKSKINIIKYDRTDGTFNTLFYVFNMRPELIGKDKGLIISWSDILPTNKLNVLESEGIKIYTDKNKIHRCSIDDKNKIHTGITGGNIPGFYNLFDVQLQDLLSFYIDEEYKTKKEVDFTDFLKDNDSLLKYQEEVELIDIGDVDKYEKFLKNSSIDQRWFNNLTFDLLNVKKTSNGEYGQKVIESEIEFYKFIQDKSAAESFPKIQQFLPNGFIMQNLETDGYVTVNKYLSSNPNKERELLDAYTKAITKVHSDGSMSISHFSDDMYKEYIQVPIERYSKINYFIPKNKQVFINGELLEDSSDNGFYNTIEKLYKYLFNGSFTWSIIHGDTNSTNTMYNPVTKDIKFIDPRGKFGNSIIYGDASYDNAKFLYGLTGYDDFNLDKLFTFKTYNDEIGIKLDSLTLLDELTDDNYLKILVGLIWLKLPFYIKNNPNKIIASYYIGMHLLNKYL